jgi:murein DD-endopeptidase MepM/ murein hydrolase activator NlpD
MIDLALALVMTIAQPPAPAAAALKVTHQARAMTPGEVIRISIRPSSPLAALDAVWLNQPVSFFARPDGSWEGFAPIDLATPAGTYTLRLTAQTTDGRSVAQPYLMRVAAKAFPTRRITVAGKFATPPADALPRIEREQALTEAIFAATSPEQLWTRGFVRPVPGAATSSFGRRSIVNGQPRSPHSGTDFQAATGTPVVAPNRGRVVLADDLYFPGQTVIIDHGAGIYSYLAHLSQIDVETGAMVERGERIGLSGATGRVTGPHLHWSLRIGKARVDPLSLMVASKFEDRRN